MPTDQSSQQIDRPSLLYGLERLALGFESADPHIRHESKMIAKNTIGQIAYEVSER